MSASSEGRSASGDESTRRRGFVSSGGLQGEEGLHLGRGDRRRAGGTHSTGMRSCLVLQKFPIKKRVKRIKVSHVAILILLSRNVIDAEFQHFSFWPYAIQI